MPQQADHVGETLSISLLGELRVFRGEQELALPASRKARALLAFLVATGRPHRRERLCELFWDLPDDPRAALRWSLTKLRKVIDDPDRPRIVADRERVAVDTEGLRLDIRAVREDIASGLDSLPLETLERMARRLDEVLFDGLDGAGGEAFGAWLSAERADAEAERIDVLRHLANHPANPPAIAEKWRRLWHAADPGAACDAPDPAPPRAPAPTGRPPRISSGLRAQKIGFCDVADGTTIAYATVGSGPPLLKAANWLTHLEFDWTSPIWGECFADIARERSFIRYDERGCGLSDWDTDDLSFDAFVEDLEAVADRLELERFPLLGISQGAAVSIEYAARHPERVSGLILFGGYAAGWRHTTSDDEKARREAVRDLTRVGWGTDNPAYRHIFSQTFMPGVAPDELAWFDEFQRLTTSPENAARFQDAFGDIDVRHRLGDVTAPTLVLHSTGDQRIPVSDGRQIARGIPGAHFVPLESRNHVLVGYEPAWQTCMAAIRDFLTEYGI
ncbi:alpha/beta fold hydrolase [Salipiger bermudensis]|uniref:alpha/beta hydrolase n=1 Tax=Salipiger bermudensis TaxID=344736 RepID=UPI001C99AB49|nr:alpha/beta hydrolase [Salipiger bermudensis]MBY6003046.1 alpha/beta fold hydrolase [Salipiger bermudensis]